MGMLTVVSAPGLGAEALDALKEEVEKAIRSDKGLIVTNYAFVMEQMEISSDAEIVIIK